MTEPDWDEKARLRKLIGEACDLVEALAQQQAIPDDFYEEKLRELRAESA